MQDFYFAIVIDTEGPYPSHVRAADLAAAKAEIRKNTANLRTFKQITPAQFRKLTKRGGNARPF